MFLLSNLNSYFVVIVWIQHALLPNRINNFFWFLKTLICCSVVGRTNADCMTVSVPAVSCSGASRRSCCIGGRRRGSRMPLIPVPIYGGQNLLSTFEMAIRHNRWTTRTELERERVFCRWIYFNYTFNKLVVYRSQTLLKGALVNFYRNLV